MRYRCNNPNAKGYEHYGGRGIKVDPRWDDFGVFKADMYPELIRHVREHGSSRTSLDRVDVNGNYSPENCRWATPEVQMSNRRPYGRANILREFGLAA